MSINIEERKYIVIQDHTSEYPEPITFEKGTPLIVGEKHEGSEGWDNWYFCESPGQQGGWVPVQVIENVNAKNTHAIESYTARELNVQKGDLLVGTRILNGWTWCRRTDIEESGWVPLSCLKEDHQ